MSFSFNGNTPRKIIFNNQDVKKLIYNNDVVWEKKRLPVEYQEVEYIESTGTQYIDTNLLYAANDRIEVDVAPVTITLDRVVFGSYISSAYVELGILTSKFRCDISNNATTPISANVRYKVVKDGATWTVDGNTITTAGSNKDTPYPIYLFGRCFNGTAQKLSNIKVYSYKHIRNNVTIADLIPCYRKIDKKPGLYDAFNDVFYTNDGTGEFNVGADIITIPTDYQRVEYIESTGTQYIDTGMVLNNGCVITLDFLIAESSVNRIIYGWRRKGRYTEPYQAMIGANASKTRYVAVGRTSTNIPQCFRYDVRNKILIDSVNEQVLVNDIVTDCGADFSNGKAFNENGSSEVHPYLFALNNAGTPLAISQDSRIYRYSVQYEGEVLQDLIPCYRKIDNAAGMYDVVNDVFYTNSGTGTFTKGPDVN